jgi:hypothetical protein
MLPAWNVQMLRDLELDLRARAERHRVRGATHGSSGPAFEVVSLAPTSEPCLEPCIEGPLARAG